MKRNINIIKIIPQGYCRGVVNAIRLIKKTIDDQNTVKPLYILGNLVHNMHVTNAFTNAGLITINDYHDISIGSVIVTAHGLSEKKKSEIKKKNLNLIDATCPSVLAIQKLVSDKIKEGFDIIYYGKNNHPECLAVTSFEKSIHVISDKKDIDDLIINNDRIFFTNQTTMSYFDVLEIVSQLQKKFPNIIINIDICQSSKNRQLSLYNQGKNCDLIIIVGDKSSNNTLKLKEICDNLLNIKSILINDVSEIEDLEIIDGMTIGITAGASTPNILVNEIINILKDSDYKSNLTSEDYINI